MENEDTVKNGDDGMNATTTIRKIDKSNITVLTTKKKSILKGLMGIVSSPIDFNKIRDEEKYGKNRL